MTSPQLPRAIVEHFAAQIDAATRDRLRTAQAAMSAVYRDGGHSRVAVPDAVAALAYAIARMPASYAACVRAFDLVAAEMPQFAPHTALDLGAGPGTATLAAAAVWPDLATAHLVEPHRRLGALAAAVMPVATALTTTIAPVDVAVAPLPPADLVLMSYMLAEQPTQSAAPMIARVAASVANVVVVVEPGTPSGYARILIARDALIAAGLHVLAPCPHAAACPLPPTDWCHFSQRLQRSAGHRHLKSADVPFEDERFSFIAASRAPAVRINDARLIRSPQIEKGFADLTLCTTAGLATRRIKRRDAAAYKVAKGLAWGDGLRMRKT